jgi:alanyl aminopeptidase
MKRFASGLGFPLLIALLGVPVPLVAQASAPPKLRLGTDVVPTRQRVDLTIVPSEEGFWGTTEIDVDLKKMTSLVWLNATDLKIGASSLRTSGGATGVKVVPGDEDTIGLQLEKPAGPGEATLHLAFTGTFELKATHGLFRQKDAEEWYVYTQFENTDARRAFPCFDEPSFKVPWSLSLHVKKDHIAVANTPVASETEDTGGFKTVRFAETRPLPAYLVAAAVGPFDVVDAIPAGKKKTPVRIITPKGRAPEARLAAEDTPQILALLEDYFGIPYPFEKLDEIAVPRTVGFSAMENPGLVTYNQGSLLARPGEETVARRRRFANVCAHELAHMWFGDLVTLAWWDDVWLNESFATWLASKVIEEWKPAWDQPVSRVTSRLRAMSGDSLVSARKIRQPILSRDDIENAFDNVSYGKGAAVIAMFESWVGPDVFRKGVRRYLTKHSFSNATAADFLAALSAEAGRDIGPAFSSFLDQAGVPLVTVEMRCAKGALPVLSLTQRRFLPMGSTGSSSQLWQVPVCVRWGGASGEQRSCTLMTAAAAELPLGKDMGCPSWVLANDRMAGYYRDAYRGDLLDRLLGEKVPLSIAERVGVLGDVRAAVDAGEMSMSTALALVPRYAKNENRHMVSSTVSIVSSLTSNLVPDDLRPNYVRLIQKMYGDRARALGFKAKRDEPDDTRLLRTSLVELVAVDGEDPALRAEAIRLARAWLKDRHAVEPEMVGVVLTAAAAGGNRELFDLFVAEAKKTKIQNDRLRLLSAIGSFRETELAKAAFDLALSDALDPRDAFSLFRGAGGGFRPGVSDDSAVRRELRWSFLKQNFDTIVERTPREVAPYLPLFAMGFCDETHRADVEAFFKDRAARYPGTPRNVARVTEAISLCSARRVAEAPAVAAFLKDY